jgi:RNA polymerase sigma-70 factor (ECF subfamily)
MPEQIEPEVLLLLHQRLLGGDRVASAELIELLLSHLMSEMERKFPTSDVQLVSDGVTDALLDYCDRPETFDPRRGAPLDRFLARAAWGNIKNLRRGEARKKAREAKAAEMTDENVVELYPAAGNLIQNAALDANLGFQELARLLPDQTDQQIFKLKAAGERRTQVFAEAMGITHLPVEQQRREVKKAKDRIDKVMGRRKEPGR